MKILLKIMILNLIFVFSCKNEEEVEKSYPVQEENSQKIDTAEWETDTFPCNITNYMDYVKDSSKVEELLQEIDCKGKDCLGKGCQLQGADFSNQDLSDFIFRYANLTGANFKGSKIENADFRNADLTKANLETNLEKSKFKGALLTGASYDSLLRKLYITTNSRRGVKTFKDFDMIDIHQRRIAEMRKERGEDCDSTNYQKYVPNLKVCNLTKVDFSDQDLSKYIFDYSVLIGVKFDGANLTEASFKGSNIHGASFLDSDLTNANLETNLDVGDFGRFSFLWNSHAIVSGAVYDSFMRVISKGFISTRGITDPKEKGMKDMRSIE
ncbi:MAG: pentapeptide repeat-containing protein [Bdellovibrionales bacterium]|nr:pentapeptide repeat-containing protein [Bdellovibrionales bacterium]